MMRLLKDFHDPDWGRQQPRVRDYFNLLGRVREIIPAGFHQDIYGSVTYDGRAYPLLRLLPNDWRPDRHSIVITAGVHGCEPAGVEGALIALKESVPHYADRFNIAVYPCLNPTGYELDKRWNYLKQDMNRNYKPGTEVEECRLFTGSVQSLAPVTIIMDLHESLEKDAQTMHEQAIDLGNPSAATWDETPTGFFIYEDSPKDAAGAWVRIGHKITDAVAAVMPVCDWPLIAGDASDRGVLYYPQGMNVATSDYTEPTSTDSHLRAAGLAFHGFTTETTDLGENGRRFTLEERSHAQAIAVRTALSCLAAPDYPSFRALKSPRPS